MSVKSTNMDILSGLKFVEAVPGRVSFTEVYSGGFSSSSEIKMGWLMGRQARSVALWKDNGTKRPDRVMKSVVVHRE